MKPMRLAKTYYDGLAEGKLLGRRCLECGAIEFPPHPACNICGYRETEWVELSGKAELLDFALPGPMGSRENLAALGDYAYGHIRMEEGTELKVVVYGINKKNQDEIAAKLPVSIHPRIVRTCDEYCDLYFELDD